MNIVKNIKTIYLIIFLSPLFLSNISFAKNENIKKLLSTEDIKIYKEIFEIQKLKRTFFHDGFSAGEKPRYPPLSSDQRSATTAIQKEHAGC